jgi:predicted 3-demethylubiquinone-9 3-methyltransferase (glyoxalase superfamily)
MTTSITQRIIPMVWLDDQAEEAANFYCSVFPASTIHSIARYVKEGFEFHGRPEGSVMTVDIELDGYRMSFLNGGPHFKVNPSISFFYTHHDPKVIDKVWEKFSVGGAALMPLDKYPWSEKYGWVQDKFGISWQVAVGDRSKVGGQSIVPSLMFVQQHVGKAEQAMNQYASVFSDSKVEGVLKYGANELPDKEGTVKHAQFTLSGQTFMVMDSNHSHQFAFNEALSLMVYCKDQKEIDYFWDKLSEGGDPKAQMCGWLKDRFGVSWQVVPAIMDEMVQDKDRTKVERVTKAFMRMKKFDLEELQMAFEGQG